MKLINLYKIQIIIIAFLVGIPAFASDLSIDYIRNQAFDNPVYKAPEPTTVNLFSGKNKLKKKKSVNVEHIDNSSDSSNLTDDEYVQTYKRAHDKKIRKKQFDITIQTNSKNKDEKLSEEKDVVVDSVSTEEDDSAKAGDPSKKSFFNKAKKNKIRADKKKKNSTNQPAQKPSNIILTADVTDYFPERGEIEAIGNAKLEITGEDFILYGDKIIFNHEVNNVRAYENVKIVQLQNVTTGDFVNIDLNTAHGWVQKPVSSNYSIRVKADEAYVYPDKIEEYDGVANIMEDRRVLVGSSSFTNILSSITSNTGNAYLKKPEPTSLKFKVKDINVSSEEGHNVIRMKNVGLYYKKFKIGVLPQLKIVTDKEQTVMQTNIPEFGSDSNLGMFAGPSFVFNMPLSSTLKVSPLLVYSQDEKKLGAGGIATFLNGSNYTQMAYGSPEDKFMLRGFQAITSKLKLNYSQNMYVSQWFMGYRRPFYSAELEYADRYYVKDLGINFEHRLTGGVYSDSARMRKYSEGRLRWMAQAQKNLLSYTNSANTFSADFGIVGQSSVAQYTTGDTLGLVRVGPMLTTTYRGWSQNLVYFQSGVAGRTPFAFDDYYYGKSNLQLLESLRLNKFISVGYLASMALGGKETYYAGRYNPGNGDFLQENMFLVSLGPDEAKVTLCYDAYRKTTAMYFSMLLGTKDMDIAFKKSTINNPDTLGGENKNVPWIKNTFNKVRYKVFPLTDPTFVRERDLYPQEIPANGNGEIEEDIIDEGIDKELEQQIHNQLAPVINQHDRMKDGM